MGFKKFLIINLKISLVAGTLGFIFYLAFSPIEKKNSKNYKYTIYNENFGKPERALYVKRKSNIEKLVLENSGHVLQTGKDIFFLSKENKAWILDTIGKDVVRFRAKKITHDSSEVIISGYTLIENIHLQ